MKLRRKKNGAAAAKPANKDASGGPKASPAKKGGRGAAPARPPARRPARAPGRARRKIDPDRQIKYAQLLGLVFIGAGFVAIGVGWAGMARMAAPDAQLPYI